jgi:hypothetical protein
VARAVAAVERRRNAGEVAPARCRAADPFRGGAQALASLVGLGMVCPDRILFNILVKLI